VVHPDFAGRYLAGVECDGATYHRSATARDRDKLREQVLRGLGWEIVRIWSTDWWVNPGGTLERLHAALTELLERDRERRANETEALPNEAVPEPGDHEATPSFHKINETNSAITRVSAGLLPAAAEPNQETAKTPIDAAYAGSASTQSTPGLRDSDVQRDCHFQASQPTEAVPPGVIAADLFYESVYVDVLQPMVEWVVQREGPVMDAVLARRIARAHGFQRTGSRIQERVEQIARRLFKTTEEAGGTFYWPTEMEPCVQVSYRWPTNDDSTRSVEEICEAELLSLARLVMLRGHSGQEAMIVMARELGLQRLREASRGRLEGILLKCGESK